MIATSIVLFIVFIISAFSAKKGQLADMLGPKN